MINTENVIKNRLLTYHQKLLSLASIAENQLDVLKISEKTKFYMNRNIISDMNEGNAPFRPRYILPDYEKYLKKGSKFLNIRPAEDIWDAVNNLLILYRHVPSITSYPVFIGSLDKLLQPFYNNDEEATKAVKFFLLHISRTITDSFCHGNIGPQKTDIGEIILKVERELQTSVPNLTMKVSKNTDKAFVIEGIKTALEVSKPSFANDEMFIEDLGTNYGIASCYNGLVIGGGSYTLSRLNLARLAEASDSKSDFMDNLLPDAVNSMCEYMDERIRYLIEESGFFKSSFLVEENLISMDNFSAMFGMVGLGVAVNILNNTKTKDEMFGQSENANELGKIIIERLYELVSRHNNKYCMVSDNKFLLHAQVGLDSDIIGKDSPGCRIPIGDEPDLYSHIEIEAEYHKYFPSGIGNIYPFDKTSKKNPEFIYDILMGALNSGMRYFSLISSDADVIRITGYLVKKSEIENLDNNIQVSNNSAILGKGAVDNQKILKRRVFVNE